MMKKILLGALGLLAFAAAPAAAADLPAKVYTKAPAVVPVPIYNWSGFYIGLNGGGGWSHKCWDVTNILGVPIVPSLAEGCHNASGGLVGGQIGYRWQSANWVFGVEAQGDWANLRGSNASLLAFGLVTDQSKINAIGLFTGQVGYAWNNVLWYGKGGAAVTDDKYRGFITATNLQIDRASETRWGGTIGTGVEVGFAQNWSAGLEYDHLFMGRRSENFTSVIVPGLFSRTESIKQDVDMVTVRVNYRFGGPIVAKY